MLKEEAELSLSKFSILPLFALLAACSLIPDVKVWLNKIDFEVAADANRGDPFVCHIVVPYSKDLYDRLVNMDAQGYFPDSENLQKKYKDSIEVFKFDLVPGKNKLDQKIKLKSYKKAQAAFLFARYSTPGKFAENISDSASWVVRFLPYKMEVVSALSLEALLEKVNK